MLVDVLRLVRVRPHEALYGREDDASAESTVQRLKGVSGIRHCSPQRSASVRQLRRVRWLQLDGPAASKRTSGISPERVLRIVCETQFRSLGKCRTGGIKDRLSRHEPDGLLCLQTLIVRKCHEPSIVQSSGRLKNSCY